MEFKDLIADIKNIDAPLAATASRKQTTAPEFKIELASYPDIVISKTTAGQTKYLVLMPSQDSYYIKTQPKGNKPPVITKLNCDNFRSFITGLNCIVIPKDFWFPRLPEDKTECARFMHYITKDEIGNMIKDRAYPPVNYNKYSIDYNWNEKLYKKYPALFRHFKNNSRFIDFVTKGSNFTWKLVSYYGLDSTRRFFEELFKSLVDVESFNGYRLEYRIEKILTYNPEISAFIDYVCYDSVLMGYGDSMVNFFTDWSDALDMQVQLYGKVKEKYPKNLPTLHNKLGYMVRVRQQEIEERGFAIQSEKAEAIETQIGDWVFIAPKTKEDFIDEATQQANCLASYVSKFANGDDYIMFMRKAEDPEASVVTIEINTKGELLQAYRARNNRCSDDEYDVIDKWLAFVAKQLAPNPAH